MTDLFVGLDADEVHERVAKKWDLSGPFPVPKPGWMRCRCGCEVIQARYWKFHRRGPTIMGRCDLHVKCTACSEAWVYGIAVPEDYYEANHQTKARNVGWRDVKAALDAEG